MANTILEEFKKGLAKKPYASNTIKSDYPSVQIISKSYAEKFMYIQPNHPQILKNLCLDIDNSKLQNYNYYQDFEFLNVPTPNIKINNPKNGHCHLIYCLENSLYALDYNQKRFFENIRELLNIKLGGDFQFNHNIIKNPLNSAWDTRILKERPYQLGEIYENIILTPTEIDILKAKKTKINQTLSASEGRNCAIFDEVRLFAYKAFYNSNNFDNDVFRYASELNSLITSHPGPLENKELKQIVKSICNFIYKNFHKDFKEYVKDSHNSEIQSKRGKKSGISRLNKANERNKKIKRDWASQKYTRAQLISKYQISKRTLYSILKEL